MKILGWVLLVAGLVGLWWAYSTSAGAVTMIIAVVVAAGGLWLALKEGGPSM